MTADHATPSTVTSALTVPSLRAFLDCFGLSSSRRWQALRFLARLSWYLPLSIQSTRISDLSAPFPRTKTRRDSTSPREVPCGSRVAFSRCSLRVSGTLWKDSPAAQLLALRSRSNRSPSLQKSPWLTNQNPEPPNSPSISRMMPSCGLNRFTSRWDLRRKPKRSRPFSTSSRPRTRSIPLPCSAWKRKSITPFSFSNP